MQHSATRFGLRQMAFDRLRAGGTTLGGGCERPADDIHHRHRPGDERTDRRSDRPGPFRRIAGEGAPGGGEHIPQRGLSPYGLMRFPCGCDPSLRPPNQASRNSAVFMNSTTSFSLGRSVLAPGVTMFRAATAEANFTASSFEYPWYLASQF